MRTLIVVALLACPESAAAQDKWFGADKAKHFGAGAAVAGGGYAVAIPLTSRPRSRLVIGSAAGLGAAGVKELRDRRRGGGSWRDFTWTAGGTAAGAFVAWIIDKATD